MPRIRTKSAANRKGLSLSILVSHLLICVCGIYVGVMMGTLTCPDACPLEEAKLEPMAVRKTVEQVVDTTPTGKVTFPKTLKKMVVDYATVPRDDFINNLEIGTPMDETKGGSEDVMVLYTDPKTLPWEKGSGKIPDKGEKHGLDSTKALENCHTVKVILQEPAKNKRQCIAIVPQWESYHVHKFMRIPEDSSGKEVSVKYPLRYVSRSMADNGKVSLQPMWKKHTKPSYDAFVDYATHFDTALKNLKPLLEQTLKNAKASEETSAVMKKSKVVVVMVCNKGQAHLFHNFVCNARAKGQDLSRIIMFATDEYTVNLAKDLGITVFSDKKIFGDMPEMAARRYGDKIFSQMMMAKIYCVHLVMNLGYDVLFQDVDVVWQKNPLEYLETEESQEWDMIFQDDGSRQIRYQPYSPNTGFYFVRNNSLTQYFFNSLVLKGDLVAMTKSHQAALAAQIAEFVSWKGLRVKVWRKFGNTLFPGGVEYHQSKDYMRRMINGDIKPFIFHMSWTQNKDNKKVYFEQMGEWYTKDDDSGCSGLDCCLAEPKITCHYMDKPSIIPCKDSPPIDKGHKSFWK